ncbi:MAG TPA: hypothetical protein VKZ53_04510 [Candidatus Angelobacter sp.]|nr:hypothetical protein [Candidatus Angelobacter sp.]
MSNVSQAQSSAPAPAQPTASQNDKASQPSVEAPSHPSIHVQPFPRKKIELPAKASTPRAFTSSNPPLVPYWGGPVISNVHVVEVLWGANVDPASTTGLEQFYTDITNSSYFDLLGEYGTVNIVGNGGAPGTNQIIGRGTFDGKFTITPSTCPGEPAASPNGCVLDDTQIQSELTNQVNAGHLPQPVADAQGNTNTLYMIYFPPDVVITLQGIISCAAGGFCGYHSNTVTSAQRLGYGVFPDLSSASACAQGCGEGSSQQNLTAVSSHELAEATTDILVGSALTFAPPLAWSSMDVGEIGDVCVAQDVPVTAGGNTYTVQQLWSNLQNNCVTAAPHFQLTAQSNANPGKPFNVSVTALTSVNSQPPNILTGYANTVHVTSSDAKASVPVDQAFVPATDQGTHIFSVTLNTSGSQTITATDTLAGAITASIPVTVSSFPDLAVLSSDGGNLIQGQTNATFTLTVSNVGNLPSSGQVTVTDTLPGNISFTPTSMTGAGWNCTLSVLTCTRNDALAPNGASYPPIILVGNVRPSAPNTALNLAHVTTAGDLNPTNDTFNDTAKIAQLPDLTVVSSHLGNFSQGEIGETYTVTVSNLGSVPTNSTVTVVDALPTGLTATSIAGTGWNCALGTLTCTRADALPSSPASFPAIVITVNADPAATPGSRNNTATVSGGGEIITSNDVSNDPTMIVAAAPDLIVGSTHSGTFTQGQQAASFVVTVKNIGTQATNGTIVTMNGALSVGLSLASVSGPNWNCAFSSFSYICNRSDTLAPSSSYPPITVQVNVDPVAPTSVNNSVSVVGGGDPDAAEAFTDATNVTQLPDLTVVSGDFTKLFKGAKGATQAWIVENIGASATTAPVTFTFIGETTVEPDDQPFTPVAISGLGWNCTLSSLSCTRSDSLAAKSAYPPIIITVNYLFPALSFFVENGNVSGGGEVNLANDSSFIDPNLFPALNFTPLVKTASVTAGDSAIFPFGVVNFVNLPIQYGCTGLPAGASCAFNPPSSSDFNTLITMTVTTTGAKKASAMPLHWQSSAPLNSLTIPLASMGLMVLIGIVLGRKSGKKVRLATLGLAALLLCLGGCGGGGNGNAGGGNQLMPTPNGSFPLTVTLTNPAANFQVSFQVTMTVQ